MDSIADDERDDEGNARAGEGEVEARRACTAAGGEDQHREEGQHTPKRGEHQGSLNRGPHVPRFSWLLVCHGASSNAGGKNAACPL